MDAPVIAESARKHGVPDEHILHALHHPYDIEDKDDGLTMVYGSDPAGNTIEVGVMESDLDRATVIVHARRIPDVPRR